MKLGIVRKVHLHHRFTPILMLNLCKWRLYCTCLYLKGYSKTPEPDIGPNVEAALASDAPVASVPRKSTIGQRKPASSKGVCLNTSGFPCLILLTHVRLFLWLSLVPKRPDSEELELCPKTFLRLKRKPRCEIKWQKKTYWQRKEELKKKKKAM